MTGHVGRTLFANFWKHSGQFFTRTQGPQASSRFSQHTGFNDAFHNFLGKNAFRAPSSPFSSYPRSSRRITRRFASGGFFVFTTSPNSTAAVESGAACVISSENIPCYGVSRQLDRGKLVTLGQNAWNRSFHTSQRSSAPEGTGKQKTHNNAVSDENGNRYEAFTYRSDTVNARAANTGPHEQNGAANHYLRGHLHRPTREELLAAATGFWSRLKVRFKWFSIRSVRPFNMDEIGALFSWVLLGHVLWIILGTTTFFSLLILAINTVFAQGALVLFRFTSPFKY